MAARAGGEEAATAVLLDGDQPLALAVVSRLRKTEWSYLEYYAVTDARRGQGIGGVLWTVLGRTLRQRGFPARLLMEVEDPADVPDGSPQRLERERRIKFYERLGARQLSVSGYATPHLDGTQGSDPMLLLWSPETMDDPHPDPAEIRATIPDLYDSSYGLMPSHPLVVAALRGI